MKVAFPESARNPSGVLANEIRADSDNPNCSVLQNVTISDGAISIQQDSSPLFAVANSTSEPNLPFADSLRGVNLDELFVQYYALELPKRQSEIGRRVLSVIRICIN